MIAWEGRSEIDGQPVVMILTGLNGDTRNSKTGPMVQTWIIRSDVDPLTAIATGKDRSVCGGCRHRPRRLKPSERGWEERSCYVHMLGIQTIWRKYKNGEYAAMDLTRVPSPLHGKMLRMGSYGDPAAVPEGVWRQLLVQTTGHTGYTHQWRGGTFAFLQQWCMASVDTAEEMLAARNRGWSTFRVMSGDELAWGSETLCPASEEGGRTTVCADCLRCDGTGDSFGSEGIAIYVHGSGAVHFRPKQTDLFGRKY